MNAYLSSSILLLASIATSYPLLPPCSPSIPQFTRWERSVSRQTTRLAATRSRQGQERNRVNRSDSRGRNGERRRSGGRSNGRRTQRVGGDRAGNSDDRGDRYDAFGDYDEDHYDDSIDYSSDSFDNGQDDYTDDAFQQSPSNSNELGSSKTSTFYSQKDLTDPAFSASPHFLHLCASAGIVKPSRIQSLAWPSLLRGENAIVADQTGSGKTFAYLLPLLQRLYEDDKDETLTQRKKKTTGSPRILVLTPTAELADQIHAVCTSLARNIENDNTYNWNFHPFVTTATGSQNTNIRDQIRLLRSTPVDVLISTPGRLATILRTKNAGLDLTMVQSMVLDEVDFLLVDDTFGPQLRTVGVAVTAEGEESGRKDPPQFLFVTATLPEDVLASIRTEFPNINELRGPGLHRITPTVHQTLVDVSVPPDSNRDARACFDIKLRELFKALRTRRTAKTLIFCNTVETCRNVENALRRRGRKSKINRVWAYHNALSAEVRLKNLHSFSSDSSQIENGGEGTERILVCTDRAARGIDFDASPVDHVILFDFPKDPAEYVRRVGRTARAGRDGASTVFAYGWQLPIARQIMYGSGKGKGKKKGGKLEKFTMMNSGDGWVDEELEAEDDYYMRGGAKRRKEMALGDETRDDGASARGQKGSLWKQGK
ncbi:hypothetical protein HJC23_008108 [Cyclotella cryptica]|uniref:P-loop containing nucleoside triphosphate hydrolase protein n=1 Tax=Cyclotella cryptica TaxID=29204 RepID=A0ABD3PDW7_9STRA|eukprot:CCRYP_015618-RA/>CCRYP_015618-RA protein AED:0.29 eAED:0.29 QI:0/-1/0/1/-1/1/1/0/656